MKFIIYYSGESKEIAYQKYLENHQLITCESRFEGWTPHENNKHPTHLNVGEVTYAALNQFLNDGYRHAIQRIG